MLKCYVNKAFWDSYSPYTICTKGVVSYSCVYYRLSPDILILLFTRRSNKTTTSLGLFWFLSLGCLSVWLLFYNIYLSITLWQDIRQHEQTHIYAVIRTKCKPQCFRVIPQMGRKPRCDIYFHSEHKESKKPYTCDFLVPFNAFSLKLQLQWRVPTVDLNVVSLWFWSLRQPVIANMQHIYNSPPRGPFF